TGLTTLSGDITTTSGGNVTFNNAVTIAGNVTINTSAPSSGYVLFNDAVSGNKDLTVTTGNGAGDVTFGSTITEVQVLTLTAGTGTVRFAGDVGTTTEALKSISVISSKFVNMKGANYFTADGQSYTATSGVCYLSSSDGTWQAGGVTLTNTDLYLDFSGTLILNADNDSEGKNITCQNFYFFNGELDISSQKIETSEDFVVFGTTYSADDINWDGTDTRWAYYFDSEPAYYPTNATYSSPVLEFGVGGTTATFDLTDAIITTDSDGDGRGNFYNNGANMDNGAFTLNLPNNSDSNPLFNNTNTVTFFQWGIPYAVAFNMQVASSTANGAYVAAATTQAVTDSSGNTNWQFEYPKIITAYTVYDDVIYVKFNMDIENSGGEINSTIGNIYCNDDPPYWIEGAYSDADCTTSISSSDSWQLDGQDPFVANAFYIKCSETWNTDATGTAAGAVESTDRSGDHKNIIPSLSMLEGVLYAAEGKTMCANYGENTAGVYTAVDDYCAPVLVKAFIGQENHIEPGDTPTVTQPTYDAHNFIELRYSEPVNFASAEAPSDSSIKPSDSNVKATSENGKITNENNGLKISGLVEISDGRLETGSRTFDNVTVLESDSLVHALYRNFPLILGANATEQTHRIRLGIAAYVDGSISVNGKDYHFWPGFINSITAPTGVVSPISPASPVVSDVQGVFLDSTSTTNHTLPEITIESTTVDTIYSGWDCVKPGIAPFRMKLKGEDDMDEGFYEIQVASDDNTNVNKVEIHFLDNNIDDFELLNFEWFSKEGWYIDLAVSPTQTIPLDDRGGSRFSQSSDLSQTGLGGIRFCSLYNSLEKFTIMNITENAHLTLTHTGAYNQKTSRSDFFGEHGSSIADNAYVQLEVVQDSKNQLDNDFSLSYSGTGFVTDLAGNRLSDIDEYPSPTKIPPSFMFSLAPVGSNNIMVSFTKPIVFNDDDIMKLRKKREEGYNDGDANTYKEWVVRSLEIRTLEDDTIIDYDNWPDASLVYETTRSSGILVPLTQSIQYEDLKNLNISIVEFNIPGVDESTVSGLPTPQSRIYDRQHNALKSSEVHCLSDFALNVVNVQYAYDNSFSVQADENAIITPIQVPGLYGEGTYAIRDFSGSGNNTNRAVSEHDITIVANIFGGENQGVPSDKVVLICDNDIDTRSVSQDYNEATNFNKRVWVPAVINSLSAIANTGSNTVDQHTEDANNETRRFTIPNAPNNVDSFNYTAGSEVQFLFKFQDENGDDICVDHDGDGVPDAPLYALRLIDPTDTSSFDLWSILLTDVQRQRGGVTILNNVINVLNKEQTVIEVDVKNEGNLAVSVLTLDGNIIKTLERGRVKKGLHYYYWDGTNNAGNSVARGLYFIRITGKGIDETRKVMCVK
ncbi:MAG TPA: FlgD immunoglobulin-like domain containing protein, partial [Treponemataceae bacterium]|nr:FlgD immunoglobulin-like domain containing protein [Treponemataceae bacterium]